MLMRILLAAMLIAGSPLLASPTWAQVSEGNKPYVPTRLEWLEMYLNAGKGVPLSNEYGYGISYISDPFNDTVIIIAVYYPDKANEDVVKNAVQAARNIIQAYAQKQGWESWLKVKERLQPLSMSQASQGEESPGQDEPPAKP